MMPWRVLLCIYRSQWQNNRVHTQINWHDFMYLSAVPAKSEMFKVFTSDLSLKKQRCRWIEINTVKYTYTRVKFTMFVNKQKISQAICASDTALWFQDYLFGFFVSPFSSYLNSEATKMTSPRVADYDILTGFVFPVPDIR